MLFRYLNVFKFVVIELSKPENQSLLYRHVKELIKMVELMTDRYQYCAQLVTACNNNEKVVEYAAKAAGNWWGDKDGSLLKVTANMLRYRHPSQIRIFLPYAREVPSELGDFLSTLNKKKFKGGLVLEMQRPHFNYSSCDSLVNYLEGAR